ncbi:MAG: TatD family hydrolase [Desulfobacteraceae bacterium]|jgi:TatD DNase family protein|nr:TatD family hydrolase [Desulfobacteraceae bacterium]
MPQADFRHQRLLVDTHAHICDAAFDEDRATVLDRAARAGVGTIIAVGENLPDAKKNLELAQRHPILRPAAGLYPAHAHLEAAREMESFIRSHRERLWAIGEVGLDFWLAREEKDRHLQRVVFDRFIQLSLELDLPLNVHSRSAGRHAVAALISGGARRVHLHAFDGRISAALPAVEAGYRFSMPPSLVRSRQKQKLVRHLPLDCLLLETDSPVLGPEPGIRNEPMHLALAARAIAEIKNVEEEAVIDAVTSNAMELYRVQTR